MPDIKSEIENTISKGTDKKKINAQVRERLLNITDALEKAGNRRKDFYAMYDFGIGSEGLRIIEENTHNGFVNVPVLEKVARDFIADKNRNNSIIQACSLLEETYTRAYDNIINNYAVGGLGNIYNRITKESTALFEVYEKLPREEALFRIFNFSNRKLGSDSLTRIGMQAEEFRAKTVAAFKEYLQKNLRCPEILHSERFVPVQSEITSDYHRDLAHWVVQEQSFDFSNQSLFPEKHMASVYPWFLGPFPICIPIWEIYQKYPPV